ncbi:hypothetical protein ACFVVX_09015 [Kitasatospora sp. NPDC058170]|uniref:hypothetical protein n=1 Tax=Kitasatospora sp. NPDC058170 TaxID=3346364 RepID=UPI0036D87CF8
MLVVLAVEGVVAARRLGPAGSVWLLVGTVALVVPALYSTLRCWTTVGPAGITICWGFGRGRTYSWQEVQWIDVRETSSAAGTSEAARIILRSGRRRALPGLYRSDLYPAPDFDEQLQRVVDRWEASTDPAARVQPPKRLRDRLKPGVAGAVVGILIAVVIGLVVVA